PILLGFALHVSTRKVKMSSRRGQVPYIRLAPVAPISRSIFSNELQITLLPQYPETHFSWFLRLLAPPTVGLRSREGDKVQQASTSIRPAVHVIDGKTAVPTQFARESWT